MSSSKVLPAFSWLRRSIRSDLMPCFEGVPYE